ncbi:hypothetical protein HK096_006828 [Nowakowskiella sp. JEL0078]|nr:hypothetical protein HK096_006828 [Nowakowskiella sp. JEL0078]
MDMLLNATEDSIGWFEWIPGRIAPIENNLLRNLIADCALVEEALYSAQLLQDPNEIQQCLIHLETYHKIYRAATKQACLFKSVIDDWGYDYNTAIKVISCQKHRAAPQPSLDPEKMNIHADHFSTTFGAIPLGTDPVNAEALEDTNP